MMPARRAWRPTGEIAELGDGRLVFLGRASEAPDTWLLGFRDSEGAVTKLALSDEAMGALVHIFVNWRVDREEGRVGFPPDLQREEQKRWSVTLERCGKMPARRA